MAGSFPNAAAIIQGEVGAIELRAHVPDRIVPRAVAVVAHPHPLFGGTMDNKIVTTLARAFYDADAATYRFNFRGVGASEGKHDEGRGETRDLLTVIAYAQSLHPNLPLWLAGFSFGGAVTLAASEQVTAAEMVLVRLCHAADLLSCYLQSHDAHPIREISSENPDCRKPAAHRSRSA